MNQLMPLPLTVSCFRVKSRLVLPFWYRLTRVVADNRTLNVCVCVCVCVVSVFKDRSRSTSLVTSGLAYLRNSARDGRDDDDDADGQCACAGADDESKMADDERHARHDGAVGRRVIVEIELRDAGLRRDKVWSGLSGAELSMGPFCVTRSNPTHQLTDPTQPNPIQLTNLACLVQPNLI